MTNKMPTVREIGAMARQIGISKLGEAGFAQYLHDEIDSKLEEQSLEGLLKFLRLNQDQVFMPLVCYWLAQHGYGDKPGDWLTEQIFGRKF